jgi:hypothetical protein
MYQQSKATTNSTPDAWTMLEHKQKDKRIMASKHLGGTMYLLKAQKG